MMRKFRNAGLLLVFLLTITNGIAQETQQPQMADSFYSEGKVYVVVVVLSIVLLGMIIYLFSMDRKLKKLENDLKNKK